MLLMPFYIQAESYEYKGRCSLVEAPLEFDDCLEKELSSYDSELNEIYNVLQKKSRNKNLIKAELSWIKFRDADCNYIALEVNEGLFYNNIYSACLINKTKDRILELQRSYFYSKWFKKNT